MNTNVPFNLYVVNLSESRARIRWDMEAERGYYNKIYVCDTLLGTYVFFSQTKPDYPSEIVEGNVPKYFKVSSVHVSSGQESAMSTALFVNFVYGGGGNDDSKADKVLTAVAGNLASLDAGGNLADSGATPFASGLGNDSDVPGEKISDALNFLGDLPKEFARQRTVIAVVAASDAPPTENDGDRYILQTGTVPNVNWDGAVAGCLVEFVSAEESWLATLPGEGFVAYDDATNLDWVYVCDGDSVWEPRAASVTTHSGLTGLDADDHVQYHTDARADTWLSEGHETTCDHTLFSGIVQATK
ncbi:MAG: hypothetical protein WC325_09375, partial [Candidatus Bathyarchaeia archaeon]